MLTLGILSVIQVLLLPGLAAVCFIKWLPFADRIFFIVPLSLIINYALVLLLTVTGTYQTPAMLVAVFVELTILVIGIVKATALVGNADLQENRMPGNKVFVWAVYLSVFLLLIPYNLAAWKAMGVAFHDSDVVISWNRWAVSWYQGLVPQIKWGYPVGSYTYPQGMPILFSETYQFIGDSRVQYFARAVVICVPYIALITFLRIPRVLSSIRSQRIALISVPIFMMVQTTGYRDVNFLFDGCADPIMAYYGVILAYLVALLHLRSNPGSNSNRNFVYLATVVASTPALIKQPGIVVAALFPAFWYYHYGRKHDTRAIFTLICSYLIVAAMVGHWYIFKAIQIFQGLDASAYNAYAELMVPWEKRPSTAFQMIFNKIGWSWLVPFFVSMAYPAIRLLMLWGIIPGFIFWALFASYDMRAFFFALPFFAIALSAGCYRMYELAKYRSYFLPLFAAWLIWLLNEQYGYGYGQFWVKYLGLEAVTAKKVIINAVLLSLFWLLIVKSRLYERIKNLKAPSSRLLAILGCLLAPLAYWGSSEHIKQRLVTKANAEAESLISPSAVRLLLKHLGEDGGGGVVASREQIFSNIPAFYGRFVFPGCEAPVMYKDSRVRYCLIPAQKDKELEDLVTQPELIKIGEQDGWQLYEKRSWTTQREQLGK